MIDIDIEELIPHRDRMKLIDEILEVDDDKAITASTVNERWPLYNDNAVNPIIFIELIAQTTGIAVGNKKKKETGKGVNGWLVGIKSANFSVEKIPLGTRLISSTRLLYDHDNYGVFAGTVKSGSDILGEIEIQVFSSEA